MSFTPRKYKDIFDEMRAMTQVVTDFEVGSVARTMYESFAYEMALLYEKMNLVYLSAYVDTAQGNQLDQVVAVLGITRSQPDYAEGIVSFQRDGAGQEIVVPQGTLVATEESSTGEKKVYQTSKVATLGATQTRVDVQVRGVERGDELETPAETIKVMPRPVPGIKFVINDAPIRLVGKRRETDEELRERAKNALISSGKATIISIENALLSLSGVRDARVKENFHRARAKVQITNTTGNINQIIMRGTTFTLPVGMGTATFKSLDAVRYTDTEASGIDKEIKIESLLEGKFGEVPLGTGQSTTLTFTDGGLNSDFDAELLTPVALEDFGLIEVYVDAPRLEEGSQAEIAVERARIEAEIERVRAAGIFSILLPAGKAVTSAVFRVDISTSLNLTPEERRTFEQSIEDEIVSFMGELRMGSNLLYGKLIKAILSIENVENITDFQGTVTRNVLGTDMPIEFTFGDSDKFIAVDEFERIKARHIAVATEDKQLKVNIAYQSLNLLQPTADAVKLALENYFSPMALGNVFSVSDIAAEINPIATIVTGSLSIRPESWYMGSEDEPRPLLVPEGSLNPDIVVTYVEKPVLGILFGYAHRLELTGAIQLVMPVNVTEEEHTHARNRVQEAIDALIDQLGPEEDVTFEAVVAAAQGVTQVLSATVDSDDWQARLAGIAQPALIDNEKIDVQPLQRAFREYILISAKTEIVELSLDTLYVTMPLGTLPTDKLDAQVAIKTAWNNLNAGYAVGDDFAFVDVKSSLENLTVSVPYTIRQLAISALSLGDSRPQSASITQPNDIHIRSIERSKMLPIDIDNVVIVDAVLVDVQAFTVTMAIGTPPATQNTLKQALVAKWAAVFAQYAVGQDILYVNVKSAMEGLQVGAPYTITAFSIRSIAQVDNLTQTATISVQTTLDIRATELALPVALLPAGITINLI